MKLMPKTQAPSLQIDLLSREPWSIQEQTPSQFTMIVVYRGYHCPICRSYLNKVQDVQGELNELGVQVIAVSADTRERALRSRDEWAVEKLSIGYGLTQAQMNDWGLYVSQGIKENEPAIFAEPGLFLVKPDGELYYVAYNSMPFGRPEPEAMLEAVKFVLDKGYPARGEQAMMGAKV